MRSSRPKKKGMKVVSRRTIFKGKLIRFELLRIRASGGRTVERELVRHPGAVVIIPKDGAGRLILVRQLRVAVGQRLWEFPAGTLEKGESAFRCAQRELWEETGFRPGRLRKLLEFFPTPGISTEKMHLFAAEDLHRKGSGSLDWDEELEVHSFSPSRVERMIRRGQIVDGKTVLGFLFFQKYRGRK